MATKGIQLAIEEFQDLTDFKMNQYLIRVNQFFNINYPKIRDWYKGATTSPDAASFKNLFTLLSESSKCLTLYYSNKEAFSNKFYHWELLENLENINLRLLNSLNLSKFLRSTRSRNSYKSSLEMNYVTKKYDTLESVQRSEIANVNFDNDWWELAMLNDLSETDYDIAGGENLKIPLPFETSVFLKSIVDNPIGERLYGKDINRKLTFKDDDLETLGYKETVLQSLDIMMETRIGTIPENPTLGYNERLVVGTTRGTVSLPILQKQLLSIFKTDDSFSSFKIIKIEFVDDAIIIDFEVNTIYGEILSKTVKIG